MYKLQPDSVTTFFLGVMDNLRQNVMVPLRILDSLLWCTYKEDRQKPELPLCEHAKICWSIPKELISRKRPKNTCVSANPTDPVFFVPLLHFLLPSRKKIKEFHAYRP